MALLSFPGFSGRLALVVSTTALMAAPPIVSADTPDPIEEIQVTARRREESAQDIPVSLTTFSTEELDGRTINRMDELDQSIPNVSIGSGGFGGNTNSAVTIRGVGSGDFTITDDPAVGTYIDGVYIARNLGGLLNVFDFERIEVLRGPQGTLFGRNTIGGAINITTKRPSGELGGRFSAKLGNDDFVETRGALDVPILPEALAARLSFATRTADGAFVNDFNGNEVSDDKLLGGRIALDWTVSEDLDVLLSYDQVKEFEKTPKSKCFLRGPTGANPLPGLLAQQNFGFFDSCGQSAAAGIDHVVSDLSNRGESESWGTSVNATWRASDVLEVQWISAWRRFDNTINQDIDASATPTAELRREPSRTDQVSTELKFSGSAFDGKLDWVGGLYAFTEEGREEENAVVLDGAVFPGVCGDFDLFINCAAQGLGLADPIPVDTFLGTIGGTLSPLGQNTFRRVVNRNFAAYTHADYHLTDRLTATAGLRRTEERRRLRFKAFCRAGDLGHPACRDADGRVLGINDDVERFDAWTPTGQLSFRIDDERMVYGGWSRGFKSGGFNSRNQDNSAATSAYDPETLDSFEVGLKSSWLGDQLVLNTSVYYNLYDDIQLDATRLGRDGSVISETFNAAEATVKGFEMELRARPADNLFVSAGWGVTDAEYDEFDDRQFVSDPVTGATVPVTLDRSGETFVGVPDWDYNVSAQYTIELGRFGDLDLRADWSARGRNKVNAGTEESQFFQDKAGFLNARVSLTTLDDSTTIALYGRNLNDRRIKINQYNIDAFGFGGTFFNESRTYGLEIIRDF
jgi:iron complex outermembrane recepter protein